MRPIEASIQAISTLDRFREGDMLGDIQEMADEVREVVPDCTGLSLASQETGVVLTLAASREEIAALDGLQYIAGGPSIDAVENARGIDVDVTSSALDEKGWQLYAQGAAAHGVGSSLTLPILKEGLVVGSVNLYASGSDSFRDREHQLAHILGAWAGGAVSNADLSFQTRTLAERAPQILADGADIDAATGILSMLADITIAEARDKLRDAAIRAGLSEVDLAKAVIALQTGR